MLTHLQIRDFAIIDAVELELRPGLTVLTGETGAGKSIVVDAAAAGCSAAAPSAEVVRHGAERAESRRPSTPRDDPRELQRWLEEQSIAARRRARAAPRDRHGRAFARIPQRPGRAGAAAARPRRASSSTFTASTNSSRWCAAARSASCSTSTARSTRCSRQVAHRAGVWQRLSAERANSRRWRAIATHASSCCATRCASSRRSSSPRAKPAS